MNSEKILVVEDNPDHVELIQLQLQFLGWESEVAMDGEEALEKVKTSPPKVILLDIMMPKIDGFEVARCLKKSPEYQNILILAVTALAAPEDRERCLKAGCNDYLAKPFTHRELKEHLEKLLATDRLFHQASG